MPSRAQSTTNTCCCRDARAGRCGFSVRRGALYSRPRFHCQTGHSLKFTGVFHSGYYDFDSRYVLIPYRQGLSLFGGEGRTGLEVWTSLQGVDDLKAKLSSADKNLKILTWQDQNPKLFAAMKLEKIGMFLLLSALLLIASFNIFGLVSLMILDKTKDMAILRAIGLAPGKVQKIFLFQASRIGIIGSTLGGGLGLATVFLLQRFPVRLPSSYYLEFLPIHVEPVEVISILLLVPILTTLSAFYPALQATKAAPVEVLRYE